MKFAPLLLILFTAIILNAQNAPISLIPAGETYEDTMQVEILTEEFNQILSLNFQINYDTAVATAINVTAGTSLTGNYNINITQPGKIIIGWYTATPMTLVNDATIFTLIFTKKANGNLALTWFDNGYSCTYSDAAYNTLNDIPTEFFYHSSSNLFLSSALPLPAGVISGETSVCPDDEFVYSVDPIPGATGYNWFIPQNSSLISGYNTPTVTLRFLTDFNSGTLAVAGTNSNGEGIISPSLQIFKTASPTIIIQPVNDTVITGYPEVAVFTVILSDMAADYIWQENSGAGWNNIGDNHIYSGTRTPNLSITNPPSNMNGNRYRCLFSDDCGYTNSTNGEATLTVSIVSNTINHLSSIKTKVSPNPFTNQVQVSINAPSATNAFIILTDISGVTIVRQELPLIQGDNVIQTIFPDLNKGVYLLMIEAGGERDVFKIVCVI